MSFHLASTDHLSGPVRGALWMLLGALASTALAMLLRVTTESLHPFVVAFFRNFFGVLFLLPWLIRYRTVALSTKRRVLHFLRAFTALCAMLTWFTALSLMPLPEAVALSFTGPLFATIGAALILHETVRLRRWSATAIGFAGVLIILRPDAQSLTIAALLVLASAAFGAGSSLVVKALSATEAPNTIVAHMTLALVPASLVPALFVWSWPAAHDLIALVLIGGAGTLAQICMAQALAAADASAVQPFDYMRLPMVAVVAYIAFGETMDATSWAGAAVIILSTIYIARREAVLARRARAVAGVPQSDLVLREKP